MLSLRAQHGGKGNMAEAIFEEITAENFPKVMKDTITPQTQEARQSPSGIHKKRSTPRNAAKKDH